MRPFTIPTKLTPLTEPQFAELHAWLDDPTETYATIRKKLLDQFGIEIGDAALCRYNQNRGLARQLLEHKDEGSAQVREVLAIMNGEPVPYDQAGIELIMKRAFDLTTAREMTPAKLGQLLRVFHYKKNCAWNERRHDQNDQRLKISDRLATVREQELALRSAAKTPNPALNPNPNLCPKSDHLGPLVLTLDDIEERATRKFGLPPRTAAEKLASENAAQIAASAPSASPESAGSSLSTDLTPREAPNSTCHMKPAQCSMLHESPQPTSPTASSTPAPSATPQLTLEQRVNAYNLARYEEASYGKDSTKVGRTAAWNFKSKLRYCPCGHDLPCPDHGDFPARFWETFSDDPDYVIWLTKKNLPYTSPHLLRAQLASSESLSQPSSEILSTS